MRAFERSALTGVAESLARTAQHGALEHTSFRVPVFVDVGVLVITR